jgi:hypothetical protein
MQLGGEYTLAAGGAAVALFGLGIANAQSELKNIATDNAAKLDALNAQIEKTKACVKPDGAAICQYEKPLSEVLA